MGSQVAGRQTAQTRRTCVRSADTSPSTCTGPEEHTPFTPVHAIHTCTHHLHLYTPFTPEPLHACYGCSHVLCKYTTTTATTVLRPLYRSTCVSWHLQLRTEGFCCCRVLLSVCPCWRQPAHSDWEKTLECSSTASSTLSLYLRKCTCTNHSHTQTHTPI